jgi:hypothetical protein
MLSISAWTTNPAGGDVCGLKVNPVWDYIDSERREGRIAPRTSRLKQQQVAMGVARYRAIEWLQTELSFPFLLKPAIISSTPKTSPDGPGDAPAISVRQYLAHIRRLRARHGHFAP